MISWLIQNNRYRHFKVNRKWGKIDDNDYDYDYSDNGDDENDNYDNDSNVVDDDDEDFLCLCKIFTDVFQRQLQS